MKAWVKINAVCECHGEGRGLMWEVKQIDKKGNRVWLDRLGGPYSLGWKALKGCYRTEMCRKVERACQPKKKGTR